MLFSLYTQPLLAFLQAERSQGWLMGLWLGDSIHIYEKLFADDLGILLPASEQAFKELEGAIWLYELASGEKLNIQKSSFITLGLSAIPQWLADKGCPIQGPGDILKYLGALLGSKIPPQKISDFYLDIVYKRVSSWHTKHISFTEKLILGRQILQAIPMYHHGQMYT